MLAHALKHLAMRLWLTALLGGLGSLALVPLLQALMGLDWVFLPVILFLLLVFMGIGWGMDVWAKLTIERRRAEGAIWERAGMRREATQRYQSLLGVVDSFLLSPGRRRQALTALLPKMTRFYLDHENGGPEAQRLLRAHLEAQPGDAEVAARWLRGQLDLEDAPPWAHDLAQRIGEALPEADEVTQLLVRFYLANGRSDHAAISLYRRFWEQTPEFRSAKAVALAQLLTLEGHQDLWALEVYLRAWTQGAPQAKLRPAVQRCLSVVAPTDENSALLERAIELVGRQVPLSQEPQAAPALVDGGDEDLSNNAYSAFRDQSLDDTEEEAAFIYRRRRSRRRPGALSVWAAAVVGGMGRAFVEAGPRMGRLGGHMVQQLRKPWGKALGLGVFALALMVLVTNTVQHLRSSNPPPPPVSPPAAAPAVTDPFTIQVAAYLKAEDAKAYATQLKAKGLDAYSTEAVGAKRNWYQVRIDHFADKAAARRFGEELKAKGLINDFYVANFRPPPAPEQK
jgi:hypothetical protein